MADSYQQIIGRYALYDELASGGMATVHIGRLLGPVGFSRTVAIKRLHPQFTKDPEFVSMFVDEARLAARIRHPNVVPTLDVVKTEEELFLVMDYVQGESLSRLMRRAKKSGKPLAVPVVAPVMAGVLHGLHAAHIARGERGEPLGIVHRDVSPQNVLVGTDGVSRVFDFGIAKARVRLQTTRDGQLKGKLAYMAPEQLNGEDVGPQSDVYAAAVVLWEALTNVRLFDADNEGSLIAAVLKGTTVVPSTFNPAVPAELDAIVMRGLALDTSERYGTAREMARALEKAVEAASPSEIGEWVEELATDTLERRAERVAEIESQSEIKAFVPDISPSMPGPAPRSSMTPITNDGGGSQLSSISVTSGRPREARGRGALLALAAVVVGGAAAFLLLRPPERPVPADRDDAPAASDARPVETPVARPAAAPTPSASVTASASAKRPSPPPRPRGSVQVAAPTPPPTPPPKKCEWKKVFDADGNHTYKEVCE